MTGPTTKKAIIEVQLDDKASSGLKKLQTSTASSGEKMKATFTKVGLAVTAITAAVAGATAAVMSMGTRLGKFDALSQGFERNFGDMQESLDKLRKAAVNSVSDFDLMQTANRAALLGVTKDTDKLAQLMVTARLRGREMGLDMTQAFNDIVTGIGRGSPLILDNLGIKIPDALTKAMESMDETTKMQTLLDYAIKDGAELAASYGEVNVTTAEKVEALKAKITNLKDEALIKLEEPLTKVIDGLGEFIKKLEETAKTIKEDTKVEVDNLKVSTEQMNKATDDAMVSYRDMMKEFGLESNMSIWEFILVAADNYALAIAGIAKWSDKAYQSVTKLIKTLKDNWSLIKTGFKENIIEPLTPDKRATGGVTSNALTMVGERGAELVSLPRGSHVYNNEDTRQMVGSAGITINVNAPVTGVDNLKAVILEAVNEATERQNRLANYNLL
jgi:hypothetical protein